MDNLPKLSDDEMEMCKKAFMMFDKDGSGTIDVKELKAAMNALGQTPSDEELYVMISQVDQDGSKEIEYPEFLHAIRINKSMSEKLSTEQDTIDAWTALGGFQDRTGKVSVERLLAILNEFDLRVNVESLLGEEGKQDLDYEEFKHLLS